MKNYVLKYMTYIWQFQGIFLHRWERLLHLAAGVLVFFVLLLSGGVSARVLQGEGVSIFTNMVSWGHARAGMLLLAVALLFMLIALIKRGLAHFIPRSKQHFKNIAGDLGDFLRLRMVRPKPAGLRSAVQAFGLLALVATPLCALIWFNQWLVSGYAFLKLHKFFASCLMLYIVAHLAFVAVHFVHWKKEHPESAPTA